MKTHTFSIVVGGRDCNASCPWCISKMTESNFKLPITNVNWRRFETACRIAQQARDGLITVLLTGKGEPTLHPELIEQYLLKLQQYGPFPLIDLQTNGVLLDPHVDNNLTNLLPRWRNHHLTLVCISIAHSDAMANNTLMQIRSKQYDYLRAVHAIHDAGLAVRLNVTMTRSGMHSADDMEFFINLAKENGIEQLIMREVTMPTHAINATVAAVTEKEIPHGASKKLFHYLELHDANRLPDLAHGASVFDYRNQNISVNHCLTDTLDPNDIRQLIFFPGGEIAYDWKYAGARLL